MQRLVAAQHEALDAVGLGLGSHLAISAAFELAHPAWHLAGAFHVEQARAQHLLQRHAAMVSEDDPGHRIQRLDDGSHLVTPRLIDLVDLVDHHHVGELNLLGQQRRQRARVLGLGGFTTLLQQVGAGVVGQQVVRIDHRHHGVDLRHLAQAVAVFVGEVEGGRYWQRLADPGAFDQQVVEASLGRQLADLHQQVFTQRAADAAVAHLHQLLVGAR